MVLCAFTDFSFEDSNDVTLEMEPAKLRTLDTRDDVSQESQISALPVSKIRSEEGQSKETRETKVYIFIFFLM